MDNLSLFPAAAGREFLVVVAYDAIHLTHYLDMCGGFNAG